MKRFVLFIFFSFLILVVNGEEKDHPKKHLHNDLGFANTLVYNINEENLNYGMHFHFIKGLNENWSIGLGYETVFANEQHHTATIIAKYHITDAFSINVGPGLTFPSKEHKAYSLSAHFEIVSIFELGPIHIGPILGCGLGKEEKHLSLGIHIGLEL